MVQGKLSSRDTAKQRANTLILNGGNDLYLEYLIS
jgi:hypothetical protein